MILSAYVACVREMRHARRILMGKPKGNRSVGRPKRRWEDNIQMDLRNWMGQYGFDSSGSG
jgi:hypothetical protein